MRFKTLALLALLLALPGTATGQSGLFDGLLAPRHVVHRSAKARPKPVARPAPNPASAPVPLPRPRPEATPAITPPPSSPAQQAASPPSAAAPSTERGAAPPAPAAAAGESPAPAPPRIYQTACPAVINGLVEARALPPIDDGDCREQSPLAVTSILVNGRRLPLSAPATFNCEMASALPGWVAEVDRYIETTQKTRIKSLTVGGSYECRPRNTPDHDSSLSEHGRADALDFVGFVLEDGRTLTVGADYASGDANLSRLLHFAHDAACTRFTTVLGPDANSLHHDHFHLDLGCHGKACTYRLCE